MNTATVKPPVIDDSQIRILGRDAQAAAPVSEQERQRLINKIKDLLKEKDISEDESRQAEDSVQKLTDKFVSSVDEVIAVKEKELMEI